MCYDIKSQLESQLKYAKRYTPELVPEILEKLAPYLDKLDHQHTSAFKQPKLLIYSDLKVAPQIAQWGLIPHWTKNELDADKIWSKTINARGEHIFDKPSFKLAAEKQRGILVVDGFFEHKHVNKKAYPHFIRAESKETLNLGCLWDVWENTQTNIKLKTFSIITTRATAFMEVIHNNPQLNEGRMPLILDDKNLSTWLSDVDSDKIKALIQPNKIKLKAHPVKAIRGKNIMTNISNVTDEHYYHELNPPKTLFDDF